MDVDFSALQKNDFWMKKWLRAVEVRDINKDGYISRADFVMMADRIKKLNMYAPKHLEKYTQLLYKLSDSFGLTDDSVKYTYDEYLELHLRGTKAWVESGTAPTVFETMFDVLDINEDGFISFEEWSVRYHTLGIDPAHARASFDAMDTDHDQKISREEFVAYHLEYFLSAENKMNSAILFGPLD